MLKGSRVRRYVQSHTLDTELNAQLAQSRGMGEACDGITEMWWDSLEDFLADLRSPGIEDVMTKLITDEAKFIDFPSSSVFLTEEHTIFDW